MAKTFLVWIIQVLLLVRVNGTRDVYRNSFISPKSLAPEGEEAPPDGARTSGPQHLLTRRVESPPSTVDVERSAELRTAGVEDLLTFKNVADSLDSNDVEYSGRLSNFIQPSKTVRGAEENLNFPQTEAIPDLRRPPGEETGAPQARSVNLSEPETRPPIQPTATTPPTTDSATSYGGGPETARQRQANPDIQDIITGIVKLLNGNVNVQANTAPIGGAGRPPRPLSTRINNRGPPRITDVPPLPPDFDVPAPPLPPPLKGQKPPVAPTRMPTPYPFDVPPQNTSPLKTYPPYQEQIVSLGGNGRPAFYRPATSPPWRRHPDRRPAPQRRPVTNYKPYHQRPPEDTISITSEGPLEDILTLDLGSELEPSLYAERKRNETFKEEEHETEGEKEEGEEVEEATRDEATEEKSPGGEVQQNKNGEEKESEKEDAQGIKRDEEKVEVHEEEEKTSEATTTGERDKEDEEFERKKEKSSSKMEKSKIAEGASAEIKPTAIAQMELSTRFDLSLQESRPQNASGGHPTLESSIRDIVQTLRDGPTERLPDVKSASAAISPSALSIETTSSLPPPREGGSVGVEDSGSPNSSNQTAGSFPYFPYRPRPGIVLDDTEYKPGLRRPVITARPGVGQLADIFDVTVSAIQGPGSGGSTAAGKPYVVPVDVDGVQVGGDVITSPVGKEGFVSIDGKRTYLNLFGDSTDSHDVAPTKVGAVGPSTNAITGTGYAVAEQEKPKPHGVVKPTTHRRPVFGRRPSQPPVRIDTCIVGDDSTCDESQNEICRTESGVSACHCRPGHARRKHRDPCRKIVSVLVSLRVDRIYERRVVWVKDFGDKNSESYQQLSYETERAMESAMSMTPFSDNFLGAKVNGVYKGDRAAGRGGVFVNLTLQLEENADTSRPTIRNDIQKHLLGVIQRRSNNVGNSALWVDSPPGSVSNLQDLDECSSPELHDCHSLAKCVNTFGGFRCECADGSRDPWADNRHRAGRHCEQCPPQRCNNRGECKYKNGLEVCICSGSYYGNQCELDGEVLGVAIGASVAAVIIIGATLVCLVMWSRRWSREQKAAIGSPVFGYMASASNTVKAPVVGGPPYQLTLEDRVRWAQIADAMAQSNHYAPEPVTGPTRPSSAVFGYPTLSLAGTLPSRPIHGTLPPIPMPRLSMQGQLGGKAASVHGMRPLDNSSSSEEEDKTDLLGRSFQVPRPKSRSNASVANQSGIYYDVDYEQNDIYKQHPGGGIPMSIYTMTRPQYYRN